MQWPRGHLHPPNFCWELECVMSKVISACHLGLVRAHKESLGVYGWIRSVRNQDETDEFEIDVYYKICEKE